MDNVSPSRVADAVPLPCMMGCVASVYGIADKYTWYFSAAGNGANDRATMIKVTGRLFLIRMGPRGPQRGTRVGVRTHPHALPSLTLRILVASFICLGLTQK